MYVCIKQNVFNLAYDETKRAKLLNIILFSSFFYYKLQYSVRNPQNKCFIRSDHVFI